MARMGSKPDRGKKCRCENPAWTVFELRTTRNGELVITFDCSNCGAFWDTKSRDMRKHLDPARKYHTGQRTYGEWMKEADDIRRGILERTIATRKEAIAELEAGIARAQKELDMLNEEGGAAGEQA